MERVDATPGAAVKAPDSDRRDGRAVEGTGLENRQAGDRLVGSNPTPSAIFVIVRPGDMGPFLAHGLHSIPER